MRNNSDFDRTMLAGCTAFAGASILQFAAVFIPFALIHELFTQADLVRTMSFAVAGALMVGIVMSWFAVIAGFCGSVAGLVPAGLFMWLRLREAVTGIPGLTGFEPAQFPATYSWALPVLHALVLGLIWFGVVYLRFRMMKKRAGGGGGTAPHVGV